ncbi:DUF2726 domain-containing protein [Deinococcus altitudinis]|uniref:DUF2726 domain-containing protein n=1 Tax=Deinococcus altitudinis TaxID=468914 RepID=UPI003892BAB8
MEFLLIVVAALALVGGAVLVRAKGRGAANLPGPGEERDRSELPDSLPVTVKRSFFSRSERVFFGDLTAVLEGTPYTAFPNVRLNDLFTIGGEDQRSTYNRLRDKHVDFLIVSRDGFVPTLAIELDGASHESEVQKKRDRVKDLVFRSAGLTLLRVDARQPQSALALAALLAPQLPGLKGARAKSPESEPGLRRAGVSRARP